MSRVDPSDVEQSAEPINEVHDGPLSRWQRRKQAVLEEQHELQQQIHNKEKAAPALTDDDMPPVESLTIDSDFSGFLSPEVSEGLRQLALRKLFHCAEFNVCDGLDDYDGDYTSFAKLGNIVTADMKHQIEMEAQRRMEELAEAEKSEPTEPTDPLAATDEPVENADESTNEVIDSDLAEVENYTNEDAVVDENESAAEFDAMNRQGDEVI